MTFLLLLGVTAQAGTAWAQNPPPPPMGPPPGAPMGPPPGGPMGPPPGAGAPMGPPPGSVLAQKLVNATPEQLRIFASGAIQLPLQEIRAGAEKAAGRSLQVEYGSARGNLKEQILAGQEFDLAILLPDVINDVRARGLVEARNYHIARIPVAIGLRGDAPSLDVGTRAGLKAALLGARSVKYQPSGAARFTVDKVLATLGIKDQIKDMSGVREPTRLEPGEYEISLFPISEILQNKQVKNLGLVPAELQVPAEIDIVIGKHVRDRKAALAFIKYLRGPAIDPSLRKGGMVKTR